MNQKQINKKFTALERVRKEIAATGRLYQEHNQLMDELLPLFIEKTDDGFIFKREITIGTEKHLFAPTTPSDIYVHFNNVAEWLKENSKKEAERAEKYKLPQRKVR